VGARVSRTYEIRADLEQLVVVEFRYPAGKRGPERHVHREHADCFHVLEGELTIEVADRTVRAGPGFFVAAPPGLVHSFRNDSAGEARFLNIHAPGMGFAAYLEDGGPFDQFEPPDDGGRPFADAVVRPPDAGAETA
jgi:quercetin dioxygenase-like cupin family protein